MERRFHQQQRGSERSRGREKVCRAGDGFARSLMEGNDQFINKPYTSKFASDFIRGIPYPLEEHSVAFEPPRSSFKKASGRPMRTLIHEEMSRENKIRPSSPSLVARLMGLDTLPPTQAAPKQQKEIRSSSPKTSYEDHSLGSSIYQHQEFKDVFEIKDSRKVDKNKHQSASPNRAEVDVEFVRQKFMEAKRLSTNEALRNSKEFDDAVKVLDSNRDLFLKVLQEPNSLFRDLHDLKGSPPAPHGSHITILKSTKGKQYEIDKISRKSQLKSETYPPVHTDARSSLRKPAIKENSGSLSYKLSKSRYEGKTDSKRRTRIVVLKPNLENTARISVPNSVHNKQFGYRRHSDFWQSGLQELLAEGKERHNSFDIDEVLQQRTKGSREIARDITKQMKYSVSADSDKDERSCGLKNSDNSDHWIISSPSYSTESSVSREAKRRLSERWRMSNRTQGAKLVGRGSSTLFEMLSQSDREVERGTANSRTVEKVSDEKLVRGIVQTQRSPSGITSKLPRSSSHPSSSAVPWAPESSSRRRVSDTESCYILKDVFNLESDDSFHENLSQSGSNHRRSFKFCRWEENKLPDREIHVNQEELGDVTHISDQSDVNLKLCKFFDSFIVNSDDLVRNSPVVDSADIEMPSVNIAENEQKSPREGESSGENHICKVLQDQEKSLHHDQVDPFPSHSNEAVSDSLASSSKCTDQPSVISVLEHPSEAESSQECFERVSADLQELRTQLQLLRAESDAYNKESEALVSSEDDSLSYNRESEALVSSEDDSINYNKGSEALVAVHTYRDEEDRDFAYLGDILVHLGIHDSQQCMHLDTYHPMNATMFENLEEQYGDIVEWPKLERRLLFDRISFIIQGMLGPCLNQHPWVNLSRKLSSLWGPERLTEEVWRAVVNQREESSRGKAEENVLDPRWLDLGDDVDAIGREVEGMLKEELLEELVSEFISY